MSGPVSELSVELSVPGPAELSVLGPAELSVPGPAELSVLGPAELSVPGPVGACVDPEELSGPVAATPVSKPVSGPVGLSVELDVAPVEPDPSGSTSGGQAARTRTRAGGGRRMRPL